MLRALNARAGAVLLMAEADRRKALEDALNRAEAAYQAADAKYREQEELVSYYKQRRKEASEKMYELDILTIPQLAEIMQRMKDPQERSILNQAIDGLKTLSTNADLQKSSNWREANRAEQEKTDLWNARVERLHARNAATERLAKFNTANPPSS